MTSRARPARRAANLAPPDSLEAPITPDVEKISELLHETAEHHDAFEKAAPPHDWWDWYGAYFAARQGGSTPDEADAAADRYMAEVKGVVVSRS